MKGVAYWVRTPTMKESRWIHDALGDETWLVLIGIIEDVSMILERLEFQEGT